MGERGERGSWDEYSDNFISLNNVSYSSFLLGYTTTWKLDKKNHLTHI